MRTTQLTGSRRSAGCTNVRVPPLEKAKQFQFRSDHWSHKIDDKISIAATKERNEVGRIGGQLVKLHCRNAQFADSAKTNSRFCLILNRGLVSRERAWHSFRAPDATDTFARSRS